MRLWSIHPEYLDAAGLVALWREGLLAKKVLQGRTKGYRHHPQVIRFRNQKFPVASINNYLLAVWVESVRRGYAFDKRKLGPQRRVRRIPIPAGQLLFEFMHLRRKLRMRNRKLFLATSNVKKPAAHPLFRVHNGPVAGWEKTG